jgi:murein DD-endopeptidase MepM/ murein hydrolase activator NlpD
MIAAPDIQPAQELLYRAPNAFTIAPVRPRAGRMMYRVQVGDTVEKIAKRFGLTQDSIIWNNDITYVNRLPAGYEMTIPPIDGILYRPTSSESIQQIADKFKVSPYAILDSEYNRLSAATPTLVIPANELEIMIPGGSSEKKAIYWKPQVERRAASGSGGGQVSFGGGAGSCGFVSSGGGDGSLGLPLNGYTVIRGYSSYHGGVDLASPTGSPIFASGTGTVIFAGWSDWGYGYTIVLAHTPDLWTLYGHLSRISVSCGQIVPRGAVIGGVGSTGNSTGPHLHFETRVGGDPVNPIQYLGGF